jgi:hypothetical protein
MAIGIASTKALAPLFLKSAWLTIKRGTKSMENAINTIPFGGENAHVKRGA